MSAAAATEWVGISELGDWCARRRATFLDLCEALGEWATDPATPPGATQQLWVMAGHRHAWHATLCAERSPAVPIVDLDALTESYRGRLEAPDAESRVAWYHLVVNSALVACETLRSRIDAQLDPSTSRLLDLVTADLNDLRQRALTVAN